MADSVSLDVVTFYFLLTAASLTGYPLVSEGNNQVQETPANPLPLTTPAAPGPPQRITREYVHTSKSLMK